MSFPSPSEYDDTIQNLFSAFIDEELKNGKNDGPLRLGVHGTVASGSFAIVYRIRCGSKRYAVKLFTSPPPENQHSRYSNIHDHLFRSRMNCSVAFHYIKDGIRVLGKPYPILKMEWMDAPTLLKHLPTKLSDPAHLRRLADSFLNMCGELRRNKVAHGDLQHGNLLVCGENLKIIDYDGMCVPGTNGLASVENGLPSYQHPDRNGGNLHLSLDHFSALVIWISLYALSLDSNLWKQHIGNAERLLFQPADFTDPKTSQIFKKLLTYEDSMLSKAVSALHNACLISDLEKIPHIEDVLKEKSEWWKIDEKKIIKPVKPKRVPDWLSLPDIGEKTETNPTFPKVTSIGYGKSILIAQVFFCIALIFSIFSGCHHIFLTGNYESLIYIILLEFIIVIAFMYLMYLISIPYKNYSNIKAGITYLSIEECNILKEIQKIQDKFQENEDKKNDVTKLKKILKTLEDNKEIDKSKLDFDFLPRINDIKQKLKLTDPDKNEKYTNMQEQMQNKVNEIQSLINIIESKRQKNINSYDTQILGIKKSSEMRRRNLELELSKKLLIEKSDVPIEFGTVEGWAMSVKQLHQNGIKKFGDIEKVDWLSGVGMICWKMNGERIEISNISSRMTNNLRYWLFDTQNNLMRNLPIPDLDPDVLQEIKNDETSKIDKLKEKLNIDKKQFDKEISDKIIAKELEEEKYKNLIKELKINLQKEKKLLKDEKKMLDELYEKEYHVKIKLIDEDIIEKKERYFFIK